MQPLSCRLATTDGATSQIYRGVGEHIARRSYIPQRSPMEAFGFGIASLIDHRPISRDIEAALLEVRLR